MDGLPNIPGLASAMASQRDEGVKRSQEALASAESGRPDEAAKAFEEVFSRQLVREMRRGLPEGFFGKGVGADAFESWLDEHLGAQLARDGALGIAGMLKAAWTRSEQGVIPASEALGKADTTGDKQ
jgi:Rod binding domain-containing protein